MIEARSWRLPSDLSLDGALESLGKIYALQAGGNRRSRRVVLDGYLHQIWHKGDLLYKQGGQLCYQSADGRQFKARCTASKFWWDLPEGELQQRVRKLLGFWSLDEVARLSIVETALVFRNEDEKIVSRASLRAWGSGEGEVRTIEWRPLRGYDAETEKLIRVLQELGAQPCEGTDLRSIVLAQGFVASELSLKGPYGIDAKQASEAAVRLMGLEMFDQARLFEAGMLEDRDTEFVHQYRVSLRKLRSLISLMKKALPEGEAEALKAQLAKLASATGTLRDLDVFLLEQRQYQALLPANYHAGFAALIKAVERDRKKALQATRKGLQAASYETTCARLRKRLSAKPKFLTAMGAKPVQAVASQKILARYNKIGDMAAALGPHSPDDDVHEIRIECKKLRYMLEFFAELYPAKHSKPLIQALKALQDLLGQFNDYAVQQIFLAHYAADGDQAAAVHGLIAVLNQKQLHTRDQVKAALADFFKPEVSQGFHILFGKQVLA